jgi:hypothetical protein
MSGEELRSAIRAGRHRGWTRTEAGDWRLGVDGDRLVGLIREVAGAYEARVLRRPTGPSGGPDPEEAHGPRVFERAGEAVDYVEANLGEP